MWQLIGMTNPTGEAIKAYIEAARTSAAELSREAGCHRSYVSHVIGGGKELSRRAAIRIWRARRVKFGPIADATDEEIEILARFTGEAA